MNKHINYFAIPFRDKTETKTIEFLNPEIALSKGSADKNIYQAYKNYLPEIIKTNNTKIGLERLIQAYYFTITDLTLYLDLFPKDLNAINYYRELGNKLNELLNTYSKEYCAMLNFLGGKTNYTWVENWPWEGEKK